MKKILKTYSKLEKVKKQIKLYFKRKGLKVLNT